MSLIEKYEQTEKDKKEYNEIDRNEQYDIYI